MLHFLRPPDAILLGIVIGATSGLIFFLGWPTKESHGWQTFLFASLPIVDTCITAYWFLGLGGKSCRLWAFKRYYTFFGPKCDIQVMGMMYSPPLRDDADMLQQVLAVAKTWDPKSRQTIALSNRSVIQAGSRTLTVDVADLYSDVWGAGDEGEMPNEEGCGQRQVNIDLRGYVGPLGQMESELRAIVALLEALVAHGGSQPTFSLIAHISGINPFLLFYLRDVPTESIKDFRLQLAKEEYGNLVSVAVTVDTIRVSARTPSALAESARRYLGAPALAARN